MDNLVSQAGNIDFFKKQKFVEQVISSSNIHKTSSALHFAPSNIALSKYWGKRDNSLFLPENSSVSLSLGSKGASTTVSLIEANQDRVFLNDKLMPINSRFSQPIVCFLDLFRALLPHKGQAFQVQTSLNIHHSSGLASSACGFAALTLCLNDIFGWSLSQKELSMIARLGSGSATRSFSKGFVIWHKGESASGNDSYAQAIDIVWDDLRWGLLLAGDKVKKVSSRDAMKHCAKTSMLYPHWPNLAQEHFESIVTAITSKNFQSLGQLMEQNCELMHSVIQCSQPAVFFRDSQSLWLIQRVIELRGQGIDIYYTQDAGHHIKVLFMQKDETLVQEFFKGQIEVVNPWV